MTKRLMLALTLTPLSFAVAHATQCVPRDNTARILVKPSPNDTDPFWKGGYIGTSWTFDVTGIVKSEDGTYLRGHLITPRGGRQPKLNFIIPREWSCSR